MSARLRPRPLPWIVLLGLLGSVPLSAQKTVYVDSFGHHRTRPVSGEVGIWSSSRSAASWSTAEPRDYIFNADLVENEEGTVTLLRTASSGETIMDWMPGGLVIPLDLDHNHLEILSHETVNGGQYSLSLQFFDGATFLHELAGTAAPQSQPSLHVLENVLQIAEDAGLTSADGYRLRFRIMPGPATRGFTFDHVRSSPGLADPLENARNLYLPSTTIGNISMPSAASLVNNGDGTFDLVRGGPGNARVGWRSGSQTIPLDTALDRIEIQPLAPVSNGTYSVNLTFLDASGDLVSEVEVFAESQSTDLRVIEDVEQLAPSGADSFELTFTISASVSTVGSGFTFDDIRALPPTGIVDPQDDDARWLDALNSSIVPNGGSVTVVRTASVGQSQALWAQPDGSPLPLDATHNRLEIDPVGPFADGAYDVGLVFFDGISAIAFRRWLSSYLQHTFRRVLEDVAQWAADQGVVGATGYMPMIRIAGGAGTTGTGFEFDRVAAVPSHFSGPGVHDPLDGIANLRVPAGLEDSTRIVDESGRHQLATFSVPLLGMQDDTDPHYLEYWMLLAKAARIDGFMHETDLLFHDPGGMFPTQAHAELDAMVLAATDLGVSVGAMFKPGGFINNTQGWAGHGVRQNVLDDMEVLLQYIVDTYYTNAATRPVVGNRPLITEFFGGEPTGQEVLPAEWNDVFRAITGPPGLDAPLFVRQGTYRANSGAPIYEAFTEPDGSYGFTPAIQNVTGAACPGAPNCPDGTEGLYDDFETSEGMRQFQQAMHEFNSQNFALGHYLYRMNSVCARYDTRSNAGWTGPIKLIHHEDGATAEEQWNEIIAHKDAIDSVMLITWSDFTESTTILPTTDLGYRVIEIMEAKIAEFKGLPSNPEGLRLPARLFHVRKAGTFFDRISTTQQTGALDPLDTGPLHAHAGDARTLISNGNYAAAATALEAAEAEIEQLRLRVVDVPLEFNGPATVNLHASTPGWGISGSSPDWDINFIDPIAQALTDYDWTGLMEFQYLDDGAPDDHEEKFTIQTESDRADSGAALYSRVAEIEKAGTGTWVKARVKLFDENSHFSLAAANGPPHIQISLNGLPSLQIKDVRFQFKLHVLQP